MPETRELLTTRRPELDARRKALIERMMATLRHFADLVKATPTPAAAAAAYGRAAGDVEALFVEQCWEALDGKPRLLESAAVALRKMRDAGRGDGGPVLAMVLQQARDLAQQQAAVRNAIAAGVADVVDGRPLLAATAAAFAASVTMAAEAVNDAAAAAAAEALQQAFERLSADLDRHHGDAPAMDVKPVANDAGSATDGVPA